MSIGTLFTLFVTPAIYTFVARDHQADAALHGESAGRGARPIAPRNRLVENRFAIRPRRISPPRTRVEGARRRGF